MRFDSIRRVAAAAGVASLTAAAGAQVIPAEVTVPLGSSPPPYAYGSGYGDVSGAGVVYDVHGGTHAGYVGYAMPGRAPVERIPVQYLRYYPGVWYGLPGSSLPVVAPQVHMPTDTTHLGFYYQRVPTWMPVPGMVPPAPVPSALHSYGVGVDGAVAGGTIEGISAGETINGERIISVRPLTSGSNVPTHSPNGRTLTDPTEIPVPPGASGGSRLPLQPPPPPAEPSTFIPPSELEQLPEIQPLFPAGHRD